MSGSDAADDLDHEDEVEDSEDEVEVVQEPASTGASLSKMHDSFQFANSPGLLDRVRQGL